MLLLRFFGNLRASGWPNKGFQDFKVVVGYGSFVSVDFCTKLMADLSADDSFLALHHQLLIGQLIFLTYII
jgi:hypothetical protein